MTRKEKAAIAFSFLAVLTGFFNFYENFFWASYFSKEAKAELVSFFWKIKIGQPQKSLEEAFRKGSYRYLELDSDKDGVVVKTPLRWGAGNWISIIQIKDGKVSGKRIRTEDEPQKNPEGSPQDEP